VDDELRWTSAVDVAALVDHKEVSPAELTTATIERIEALDAPLASVVIPLFDRALDRAGTASGVGVPILLKDAGEEVVGTPHWVGTQGLRAVDHRSPATTPAAVRLEELGFVIVGKSACPELSSGSTTEPVGFAPTRNPWDLGRSAGGSSGGSAAAVAAGLVPLAQGSDGTGSLRFPAALCGVCTLKPSRGRIASTPAAGGDDRLHIWTQFALARDVRDLRWLFGLLVPDAVWPAPPAGLRVGYVDADPILGLALADDCAAAVRDTGSLLDELGQTVDRCYPPAFDSMVTAMTEAGSAATVFARRSQLDWMAERLGRPVERGDVTDEVLELAARAESFTGDEVQRSVHIINDAMLGVLDFWIDHDLLITPVTLEPAWPLGEPAPPKTGMFAFPFSFTGQPALVVPVGRTAAGLPVGVQIVGRPGDDELLLTLGHQLQDALGWLDHHPSPELGRQVGP
jgi:amidase